MNSADVKRGWPWLNDYEVFPRLSGYRPVIGDRGMITTPHYLASAIGSDILKQRGNAVDAAIAASAALMVVCPMQCGPGGDAMWLIGDATGTISALDAAGPAPSAASSSELHAEGLSEVPKRGGCAVTVPGAVDGWFKAHSRFGSLSMEDLLAPAAALAERGFNASRHTRASFLACEEELRSKSTFRIFDTLDQPPYLYERVKQSSLADLLKLLGRANPRWFYEGEPAKAMAVECQRWGGWLAEGDLAGYSAKWVPPISTFFRGFGVFTTPPPSQGFSLLAALKAVEFISPAPVSLSEPSAIHLQIEAVDAALEVRDRLNGDTTAEIVRDALKEMKAFAQEFNPNRHRARRRQPGLSRKGDTAHLAVIDKDGLAVSLIQSLFFDFGTCIAVLPGGFTLQNRGAVFSLEEDHPAILMPGRRPPHTLMATICVEGSQLRYVLGAMGGDAQMQTQLQLLVDMIDGGLDPQQAVSRARWFVDRGVEYHVVIEDGAFDVSQLEKRGHKVTEASRFEEIVGHAEVIGITANGVRVGAADPRSDGQVAVA
jgi:gamma-glutamyltranspeptidase/glutathione hydrolase